MPNAPSVGKSANAPPVGKSANAPPVGHLTIDHYDSMESPIDGLLRQ